MNCQDARKHLHPYLDNELEVSENLAVVAHVGNCAPCQKLFGQEEAGRARCVGVLTGIKAPLTLIPRIEERLGITSPKNSFLRWAKRWAVPGTIAAVFALYVAIERPFSETPQDSPISPLVSTGNPKGDSNVHKPAKAHDHGDAVVKFVSHVKSINPQAAGGGKWLSRKVLEKNKLRALTASEARAAVLEWLGADSNLLFAEELFGKGAAMSSAVGVTEGCPKNRKENQLLVDGGASHRFGVFVLAQDSVDLKHFHLEPDGITEDIKLERCRHCKVIAVTRGDEVLIIITEKVATFETLLDELKETL